MEINADFILSIILVSLVYLIIGMIIKSAIKGEEIIVDLFSFSDFFEFLFIFFWPIILIFRLLVGIVRVLIGGKF